MIFVILFGIFGMYLYRICNKSQTEVQSTEECRQRDVTDDNSILNEAKAGIDSELVVDLECGKIVEFARDIIMRRSTTSRQLSTKSGNVSHLRKSRTEPDVKVLGLLLESLSTQPASELLDSTTIYERANDQEAAENECVISLEAQAGLCH